MGKKRKSIASSLDEVDRTMYASFCSAANSLSQLYTQAMHHQKLSFQAGERHGLEKLYQWIRRQQEAGSRITTADILNYIQMMQNELDCHGDDVLPRAVVQHQNLLPLTHFLNSNTTDTSGSTCQNSGQVLRGDQGDQPTKNSVFSNALSSPLRHSLQNYHISQQNKEPNSPGPNDSSMDMHSE